MHDVTLSDNQIQFLLDVLKNTQVVGQVGSTNLLSCLTTLESATKTASKGD